MNLKSLLVAVTAFFLAVPAFAQDSGFYAGGGIGQAKFKDACGSAPGITVLSCDDKDTAWRILAGYQFNRNFAVEGGYTDLGEVSGSGLVLGLPFDVGVSAKGWELLGVASVPFNNELSAYAKAGIFRWKVKGTAAISGLGTGSVSDNGTDFTFGVGLRYDFTKSVGARLEWQRYNDVGDDSTTGKADINLWSLGIVVKF